MASRLAIFLILASLLLNGLPELVSTAVERIHGLTHLVEVARGY